MSDDDREHPGPFKREDPQYFEALREKSAEIAELKQEINILKNLAPQRPHPGIKLVADALWSHLGGENTEINTRYQSVVSAFASFMTCLADDINDPEAAATETLGGLIYGLEREVWLQPYTEAGITRKQAQLDEEVAHVNELRKPLQQRQETLDRMRRQSEG